MYQSLNWHLLIRSWLFRITSSYQNIEHWSKDATQRKWCSNPLRLTVLWWWTIWKTQLTKPMPACQWDCISSKGERWNMLGERDQRFTIRMQLGSGWNVTEQCCLKMPGIGPDRLNRKLTLNAVPQSQMNHKLRHSELTTFRKWKLPIRTVALSVVAFILWSRARRF